MGFCWIQIEINIHQVSLIFIQNGSSTNFPRPAAVHAINCSESLLIGTHNARVHHNIQKSIPSSSLSIKKVGRLGECGWGSGSFYLMGKLRKPPNQFIRKINETVEIILGA